MSMDDISVEYELEEIKLFFVYNLDKDAIWMRLEECKNDLNNRKLLLQTLNDAMKILENTKKLENATGYLETKDRVNILLVHILINKNSSITGLKALLEQLKRESYT
jgi:hypothetical protein